MATQDQNQTSEIQPAVKKPFVVPIMEKIDIALTENGTGSYSSGDFSTYAS